MAENLDRVLEYGCSALTTNHLPLTTVLHGEAMIPLITFLAVIVPVFLSVFTLT